MAKTAKGSSVPDAGMADVEMQADQAAAQADERRSAAKKLNCKTCRYLKDSRRKKDTCPKLRIQITMSNPKTNCDYWRRPWPV